MIRLFGNHGILKTDPGRWETRTCNMCGSGMNVRRNVLGATQWAEAAARRRHRHDVFTCPNIRRAWHRQIEAMFDEAETILRQHNIA